MCLEDAIRIPRLQVVTDHDGLRKDAKEAFTTWWLQIGIAGVCGLGLGRFVGCGEGCVTLMEGFPAVGSAYWGCLTTAFVYSR